MDAILSRTDPQKLPPLVGGSALAALIFALDLMIQTGVATGVLYVFVVIAISYIKSQNLVTVTALLCCVLTLIGYWASPPGSEPWMVLANRSIAIVAILLTAMFARERFKQEHAHSTLNAELAESNELLTQSNMDLQQFAYIASHDLQAPLRHISGFVQLLQNRYSKDLDAKANDWIDRTVQGVGQMQTLIRDLLMYSRVESKSKPFEPVALAGIVDTAVDQLSASIRETGAQVTYDSLPAVVGDASQLTQLMQNLLGNGIKYHGEASPELHVSAQRSGTAWQVSVRDNGIGIAEKHLERIFEIFRRLHTARDYPGTGIGLAICRRIVMRHGGRIWANSVAGSGATFHFTLPDRRASG